MPNTLQFKRGALSGLPSLSAGEPGFTTDQFRLYVGSAGGNRLVGLFHNVAATSAPTVNDDAGDGYSVGSRWIDTTNDKSYVCVDSTVGAAVWQQTSGTGTGGITQLTGDVTAGAGSGSQVATIANDAVTNAKLANVATATIKGRVTSGTGDPEDLTGTQATTLLDVFTSSLKGLVPASGGGTTNFLRADGTFAAPPSALDITGLTAADPADADELPVYSAAVSANRKVTVQEVLALSGLTPGGRLTGSSTLPVTTADVTPSTLYYLPFVHSRVPLWDGTRWLAVEVADSGVSVALSGLTVSRPYDVFGYLSAGALALEYLAWTNDTTRATAVTIQDGRYCKSGDKTRLYLGTFYANATSSTVDSTSGRYLWNMYNRRPRTLRVTDSTDNWTYGTAAYRAFNNSTANRVHLVIGISEDVVEALAIANVILDTTESGNTGIGIDSTTVNSAQLITTNYENSTITISIAAFAHYSGYPGVGYHYIQQLEYARIGTVRFDGDGGAGAGGGIQSGLTVRVFA